MKRISIIILVSILSYIAPITTSAFDWKVQTNEMEVETAHTEVINLNAICGLNPTLPEYLKYFRNPDTDQLHPNSEGHHRMALAIAYQFLTYPLYQ